MFFILSKLLFYVLMPPVWIAGLLIFSLATKNISRKKRALLIAFLVFFIYGNDFLGNAGLLLWEKRPVPISSLQKGQTAIVLTGVTMARLKAKDRVFFSKGADRVLHTVQLYKLGIVKKIIITGGSGKLTGDKIGEAENLKTVFNYCGVPDDDLILETTSRNTRENASNTKQILDSMKIGQPFLLVTSAFHMRRAEGCFEKAGLQVTDFPVDYMTHENSETTFDQYIIPSAEGMQKWSLLIHELTGYITYKILGYC